MKKKDFLEFSFDKVYSLRPNYKFFDLFDPKYDHSSYLKIYAKEKSSIYSPQPKYG